MVDSSFVPVIEVLSRLDDHAVLKTISRKVSETVLCRCGLLRGLGGLYLSHCARLLLCGRHEPDMHIFPTCFLAHGDRHWLQGGGGSRCI